MLFKNVKDFIIVVVLQNRWNRSLQNMLKQRILLVFNQSVLSGISAARRPKSNIGTSRCQKQRNPSHSCSYASIVIVMYCIYRAPLYRWYSHSTVEYSLYYRYRYRFRYRHRNSYYYRYHYHYHYYYNWHYN